MIGHGQGFQHPRVGHVVVVVGSFVRRPAQRVFAAGRIGIGGGNQQPIFDAFAGREHGVLVRLAGHQPQALDVVADEDGHAQMLAINGHTPIPGRRRPPAIPCGAGQRLEELALLQRRAKVAVPHDAFGVADHGGELEIVVGRTPGLAPFQGQRCRQAPLSGRQWGLPGPEQGTGTRQQCLVGHTETNAIRLMALGCERQPAADSGAHARQGGQRGVLANLEQIELHVIGEVCR